MNFSNSSANKDAAASCRLTKKQDSLAALPVIAINLGSCPVIILMNTLVIFAIKTRRPLQSNYNILLACLAATDMVVGLVSQPLFIAQEIYYLSGASLADYCDFYKTAVFFYMFPSVESLLMLALLSIERYIAMKYSLRYSSLVTTPRLTIVVFCSWIISVIPVIFHPIPATHLFAKWFIYVTVMPAILIIVYCHTTVYFVSRRHMKRIKTEQLPSEGKTKFLEERKAFKTTSIIIALVFLSYVPILTYGILKDILRDIVVSCVFLNSLINPFVYCWRKKDLRKVIVELLNIRQKGGG